MTRPDYRNSPTLKVIAEWRGRDDEIEFQRLWDEARLQALSEKAQSILNEAGALRMAIAEMPAELPPQPPLSFLDRVRNCWRNLFNASANNVPAESKINDVP